jgi:hypothetical protein
MSINYSDYSSIKRADLCRVYLQTDTSNWADELKKIDADYVNELIDGISNFGDKKIEVLLDDIYSSAKVTNEKEFISLCKKIILTNPSTKGCAKVIDDILAKKYESSSDSLMVAITFFDGADVQVVFYEYDGIEIKIYIIDNENYAGDLLGLSLYEAALEETNYECYWGHVDAVDPDFIIRV